MTLPKFESEEELIRYLKKILEEIKKDPSSLKNLDELLKDIEIGEKDG
jgi:hypothetical protein